MEFLILQKAVTESVWFYTFSTSAQVLAAISGIFSVFVVYSIQEFSDSLSSTRNSIMNAISYASANINGYKRIQQEEAEKLKDFDLDVHYRTLLELLKNDQEKYGLTEVEYRRFNRLVEKKRTILREFILIIVISFVGIAISLFALVREDLLRPSVFFIQIAFSFFVFSLFIIGLGTYKVGGK